MTNLLRVLRTKGIRQRVLLIALIPGLLLGTLLGFHLIDMRLSDSRQALEARGKLLVRQLAMSSEFSLFAADPEVTRQIVTQISDNQDVEWTAVIDAQGRLIATSKQFNPDQTLPLNPSEDGSLLSFPIGGQSGTLSDFSAEQSSAVTPLGQAFVKLSSDQIDLQRRDIVRISLLFIFGSLLVTLPIAMLVGRSITRPIRSLTNAAEAIQKGQTATQVNVNSSGELGKLEQVFNQMAANIARNQETLEERVDLATTQLKEVVIKLEQRNSELQLAQRESLAAAQEKAEFLARMSHEIRTPLNSVIGFSQVLKDYPDASDRAELIDTVNLSANHLLGLIDDILNVSSLDSGSIELEYIPFDLHSVLEGVVSMLATTAHQKQVELTLMLHNDLPRQIVGDPNRLTQILVNLIGNALKFTDKGQVFIDAELLSGGDQTRIGISVSDTGIGMDQAQIARLFNPFTQADSSISRRYGGSGLGLYICRQLLDLMHGEIGVDSALGRGSRFHLSFPTTVVSSEGADAEFVDLHNQSVLIYDSLAITRRCLRATTAGWNMRVSNVDTLPALIQQLSRPDAPDLLMLSLNSDEQQSEQFAKLYQEIRQYYSGAILALINLDNWPLPDWLRDDQQLHWTTRPYRRQTLYRKIRDAVLVSSPAYRATNARAITEPEPGRARPSQANHTLLIVDDQAINRRLIRRYLQNTDLRILEAVSGQQAIDMARDNSVDLIFMDIHMPDMSGIESAIRIKELCPTHTPYIISLSADVFVNERIDDSDQTLPFDESMLKPVVESEIRRAVCQVLGPVEGLTSPVNSGPTQDKLRRELNTELLAELLKLKDQAEGCLSATDWRGLREVCHKMVGVVGLYQLDEIKPLCLDLQQQAATEDTQACQSTLARIGEALEAAPR